MAPQKLTDAVLESILWNKVPVKLQKEVKEITDGSVQELLQKLLRAESVVEEQERRKSEGFCCNRRDQGRANEPSHDNQAEGDESSETSRHPARAEKKPSSKSELNLQVFQVF